MSPTGGFIAAAGFTHSLTPARNCTFGCTYCYVPTMRVRGGLQREDWERWGQFATFKENAAELLSKELKGEEIIYCSPLTDPYQPVEAEAELMPRILAALRARPPLRLVVQTRAALIERDLVQWEALAAVTDVRVSFSITTNREEVRRWYEPLTDPLEARLRVMERLRGAGLRVYATLAPLLPCDPEELASIALAATSENVIGDPFHNRCLKQWGATTDARALRISAVRGLAEWHSPEFQMEVVERIRRVARKAGRDFGIGPEGFKWLAQA